MTFVLTTPLYYVNDKPHLGSTYTTLACDSIARYQRLEGNHVIFITGVDEHGQKIQRTAEANNRSPISHCDEVSIQYLDLWSKCQISFDQFIRTTSTKHKAIVHEFFKRVEKSDDIYMGHQQGWYCVGCEEFKDTDDSQEVKICDIHLKPLEWRNEQNIFFRLSKYQKQIEELVNRKDFIYPINRRNEIRNFVSTGLKDFSISRINVSWGIPVPGNTNHTFYVWFDALLGYISSLQEVDEEINLDNISIHGWPASLHVVGKDILRFHTVYWPAMLISAGLDLPSQIFAHGFLTREGKKMGKSLGNVIDPMQLINDYGIDSVRWYLLRDFQFGQDGDFQIKRFIEINNNDLANCIGNLLNRTTSMSRKWFDLCTPDNYEDSENVLSINALRTISEVRDYLNSYKFSDAAESILSLARLANIYLNDNAPWKLIKHNNNDITVKTIIYNVLETTRIIGTLLLPILPNLSKEILVQLAISEIPKSWESSLKWGGLKKSQPLPQSIPVINRLEMPDDT